jgi:hypothetical protein
MSTLLYPYCTVANVQAETRNTDDTEIDLFTDCINAASRAIDDYCHRDFLFHDHSSSVLVVPSYWIALNRIWLPFPCIELTEIQVDGEVLPADQYRLETAPFSKDAKIVRVGRWLRPDTFRMDVLNGGRTFPLLKQITLQGKFGYALDATNPLTVPPTGIPANITRACTIFAAVSSGRSTREYVGVNGDRQTVTLRKIPAEVTDILDRYRIGLV